MFVLASTIACLFPRPHFYLEPEKGGESTGGEGAHPQAALMARIPGGDMLAGATGGAPAEDDQALPREWTAENAQDDEEEVETGSKGERETEDKPAAEAKQVEGADDGTAPDMKDWPEAARTHAETLGKEVTTLQGEKETLGKEIATLKATQPAPLLAPTHEMPLANVTTEEHLAHHARVSKEVKSWAMRHLASGGEMPKELYALARNRDPKSIQDDELSFTPEQVAGIMEKAEVMGAEVVPARREYLRQENEQAAWIQQTYPAYLDSKAPEGQLMAQFEREFPQVKTFPHWRGILAAAVRGHLAFQGEAKERAAKAKGQAAEPPLAPPPPARSTAAPVVNGKPSSPKPKRTRELSASMSTDDLARIFN